MTFFYFGSADRQLFGSYHASGTNVPERGAAVLCPPWGPEYIASHRVLRRLAVMLSESGYHVLRFDYYGTGDSAGMREDGDMESWYADASAAVDELRDMSGATSVTVFGVRLGAHIAWKLALGRQDVDVVVLWDPVTDGSGYVQSLIDAQSQIDRWWLTSGKRRPSDRPADGTMDLLGFPLTTDMRKTVEGITLAEYRQPTRARVFVFYSSPEPGEAELREAFASAGTNAVIETTVGQRPWREDDGAIAGHLPFPILERMVEVVA